MVVKLKNKNYLLFAVYLLVLAFVFTSCASTKKEEVFFEKIVHPREYFFDIYEVDDYPKLKKEKKTDTMRFSVDFSEFVKYDTPQPGDSLTFKYKCKANKDMPGTIYAYLTYPDSSQSEKLIFATGMKKNQYIENQLTFTIKQNLENVEFVVEYYEPIKYSTIYFSFDEVMKSTDTKQEKKDLEKAIKKGYVIVDKNTGLRLDNGLPPATETTVEENQEKKETPEIIKEEVTTEDTDITPTEEKTPESKPLEEAKNLQEDKKEEEEVVINEFSEVNKNLPVKKGNEEIPTKETLDEKTQAEKIPAEIPSEINIEHKQNLTEKKEQTVPESHKTNNNDSEVKKQQMILAEERAKLQAEQALLQEERAKLEAEKARFEAEAKAKKESDKEKERIEMEHFMQQQKLEETIEAVTNTDVQRYEKEYLNDYAVPGYTFDIEDKKKNAPKLFANPNKADNFGVTLLMEAAKEGNDWKIEALINAGADVNMKDRDGWTPLMYAVRYHGNMDCVELLINAGADVKSQNNYGTSALILASNYNSNPEILKKLLSYYSPNEKDVLKSFIQVLTENQDEEYIQLIKVNLFLDLSVPLNSLFNGKTPLMYAAESGRSTKVIEMLMENSNTAVRSREGKTAFDYAKENPKLKHDDIYWSLNNK